MDKQTGTGGSLIKVQAQEEDQRVIRSLLSGPKAAGCFPQVADGPDPQHRGSDRPGGTGAVHRSAAMWVQSLNQDIQLADNHLVACPRVGEPRSNVPPWPPPRRQGSLASEFPKGFRPGTQGGVSESTGAFASYPPLPSLCQSLGHLSVAEEVVRIHSTGSAPLTDSCSSLISCSSFPIFP